MCQNYILFAFYRDASGEDKLNVKFEPGELREAARTFEEGNIYYSFSFVGSHQT